MPARFSAIAAPMPEKPAPTIATSASRLVAAGAVGAVAAPQAVRAAVEHGVPGEVVDAGRRERDAVDEAAAVVRLAEGARARPLRRADGRGRRRLRRHRRRRRSLRGGLVLSRSTGLDAAAGERDGGERCEHVAHAAPP